LLFHSTVNQILAFEAVSLSADENLNVYLLHSRKTQSVFVVGSELHESHVRRLRQLGDGFNAREKPGKRHDLELMSVSANNLLSS